MTKRAEQRAETRERIVEAATATFAERGFLGASTREIAARANANQGLITYHFKTKDELWRAAADRIFGMLRARISERVDSLQSDDPRELARELIREYVRFTAEHPELFRLMLDEGSTASERLDWLVEAHLRPEYENFVRSSEESGIALDPSLLAHGFYVMVGAGSTIFANAPEVRRLTGLDPTTPEAIETHAELVARLLVP